jgi:hypothetical protein
VTPFLIEPSDVVRAEAALRRADEEWKAYGCARVDPRDLEELTVIRIPFPLPVPCVAFFLFAWLWDGLRPDYRHLHLDHVPYGRI